jgi:hypothetical protein
MSLAMQFDTCLTRAWHTISVKTASREKNKFACPAGYSIQKDLRVSVLRVREDIKLIPLQIVRAIGS